MKGFVNFSRFFYFIWTIILVPLTTKNPNFLNKKIFKIINKICLEAKH